MKPIIKIIILIMLGVAGTLFVQSYLDRDTKQQIVVIREELLSDQPHKPNVVERIKRALPHAENISLATEARRFIRRYGAMPNAYFGGARTTEIEPDAVQPGDEIGETIERETGGKNE